MHTLLGKGDLVGSDINVHLVATSNGQMTATTNSAGQDVVVRSSSDIKVRNDPMTLSESSL